MSLNHFEQVIGLGTARCPGGETACGGAKFGKTGENKFMPREIENEEIQEPGTIKIQEPGTEAIQEPGTLNSQEPGTESIQEPGTQS